MAIRRNWSFVTLCFVYFISKTFLLFIGCPKPGLYGPDCSVPCPNPHCRHCHPETGTCQECKEGYQGYACQKGDIVYRRYYIYEIEYLIQKMPFWYKILLENGSLSYLDCEISSTTDCIFTCIEWFAT